jgi:hypothetical protein
MTTSGGHNPVINGVTFAGTFPTSGVGALSLTPDGIGGTLVTVACFAAGTRIATLRGNVAVENLREGDQVRSAFGGTRPVVWLGHRRIVCASHSEAANVCPVRVRAGAFGEGVPSSDVWLSPDHAVYIEGVLIPVRYLANGTSIMQEVVDAVTYWHVELTHHDVILAEGLLAESYLDTGNRAAFAYSRGGRSGAAPYRSGSG